MKNIVKVICLTILMVSSSCNREEWLDIKPRGLVIPSTVNDYRLLLDQVDKGGQFPQGTKRISPGFGECYSNTDYMSDDFVITDGTFNNFGQTDINKYTWSDNVYQANEEDGDWQQLYGQIYPANIVIEEVMEASNGSVAEKLELLAEAKMHRAFCYFALVNMYGLHYNPTTSSTDLAVPLRLDSRLEDVDLSRVSVQEIYDLMINDVTSAAVDLPSMNEATGPLKHRPTKLSAYAFLARLHLYMGNYEAALDAASNALAIYDHVNDYNENDIYFGLVLLFDEPEDDRQLIWQKASRETFSLLVASDELFNLYEDNDLRKLAYTEIAVLFGIPEPGSAMAPQYFNSYRGLGFTVPEILLIRAESNARLGNTAAAVNDLNTLRVKRYATGTYTNIASTDPVEVLNWVKDERRRELAGNGLRFFDLKRYNVFDNANISLTRNLNGQTYTLSAGGKNWAVPIAQKYLLENPEIGENVRD